jgi:hypothetical protein
MRRTLVFARGVRRHDAGGRRATCGSGGVAQDKSPGSGRPQGSPQDASVDGRTRTAVHEPQDAASPRGRPARAAQPTPAPNDPTRPPRSRAPLRSYFPLTASATTR